MKKIKRIASGLVGVLALTGAITVGGGAVTAERADAYTESGCYRWSNTHVSCYIDYNWYEESWWGGSHKDGRKLIYRPLVYGYR